MTEMIQCLKKLSIAVDALSASPTKPEARYRQEAATPERPCFRCHQLGHWARNCPLDKQPQRKVRLVTGAMGEGGSDDSDVDQAPILMVTPAPGEAEAQGLDDDDDDDEPIIMGAVRGPREWYLMVTVAGVTVPMLHGRHGCGAHMSISSSCNGSHTPGVLDATRRLRLTGSVGRRFPGSLSGPPPLVGGHALPQGQTIPVAGEVALTGGTPPPGGWIR